MRVRVSASARHYLRQESSYLRKHSPHAAEQFLQWMTTAFKDLATFTGAGHPEAGLPLPGTRRLIRHGYYIDYQLERGNLSIIGIANSVNTPLAVTSDDPDYEA